MKEIGNYSELKNLADKLRNVGIKSSELSLCFEFLLKIGNNPSLYSMILELINAGVRASDLKSCSDFMTSGGSLTE